MENKSRVLTHMKTHMNYHNTIVIVKMTCSNNHPSTAAAYENQA